MGIYSGNPDDEGTPTSVPTQPRSRLRRFGVMEKLLLLDLLRDPESRPTFIWAASTLLVGAFVYHLIEGWDYLSALYFCVITLATIGFGDITPTTQLGRAF